MKLDETMAGCYASQFDCLDRLFKNRRTLLSGFPEYFIGVNPDRIYLVGSGTSFHACSAAAPYMEEFLQTEVAVNTPTALNAIRGGQPLVIAVSQSGLSTNTRDFVKRLRAEGVPVVTLTDPKNTPVSEAADFPVLLQAENEKIGPKTRGYTATVLTLYLMALEAAFKTGALTREAFEREIAGLRAVIETGPHYLESCGTFFEKHRERFAAARFYIFAGKGAAGKVAAECALKILETVCVPAMGYEYEEFLHGPAFCADENMALFLFLSDDDDRMLKTADIMGQVTENCYIISHGDGVSGDKVLRLPAARPGMASPFTDVLIAQLISAALPEVLGRSRHPAVKDFLAMMDTKVR